MDTEEATALFAQVTTVIEELKRLRVRTPTKELAEECQKLEHMCEIELLRLQGVSIKKNWLNKVKVKFIK